MNVSALAVVAGLAASPAFAQQDTSSGTDHQTHHQAPQASPAPTVTLPGQPTPGMQGRGMMGGAMPGMGSGTMSCPMMGGGMAGMMAQGGMAGAMAHPGATRASLPSHSAP